MKFFMYPLKGFRQGGCTAKSGDYIVDGLKKTRLEAGKAVRKQLNNLSKGYSGPEVRQVPMPWLKS